MEPSKTRLSLLEGLKGERDLAIFEFSWQRFNEQYTPLMFRWATGRGLNRSEAEEVVQDLMVCLLRKLQTFEYDRSKCFRGWLKTVTENASKDFLRQRQRMRPTDSDALQVLLDESVLETQLEHIFDLEVLATARERVRESLNTEVGKRDWEIFCRLEYENILPQQLAEEYGMTRQSIYVVKARILERLRREVRELAGEEGELANAAGA